MDLEILNIAANTKNNITHTEEKHIHIQKNMTHTKNRIQQLGDLGPVPSTSYNNINDAYEHKQNLENLQRDLEAENKAENPHIEQIETLKEKKLMKELLNQYPKEKR